MINTYIVLLRGVNVGGKNKVSMTELQSLLEEQGFENIVTYIQSGNVILHSELSVQALIEKIENILHKNFKLDSLVKVLVLEYKTLKTIVADAPKDFGKANNSYRYYVLFLMGINGNDAMKEIDVRDGVDAAWHNESVVYYRLPSLTSPNATKSYLNKVTQKPLYKRITMRNWNTTVKLLDLASKLTV